MANWFYSNLGDAIMATESLVTIRRLFIESHAEKPNTEKRTIYFKHVSEGRLHCEVFVYFSPSAKPLAITFEASPCEQPFLSELGILISD